MEIHKISKLSLGLPYSSQRYDKKYGRDEHQSLPRCMMAAKFISAIDPTGEITLKHWVQQGQIQDLHRIFNVFKYIFSGSLLEVCLFRCHDFRTLDCSCYGFPGLKTLVIHSNKALELLGFRPFEVSQALCCQSVRFHFFIISVLCPSWSVSLQEYYADGQPMCCWRQIVSGREKAHSTEGGTSRHRVEIDQGHDASRHNGLQGSDGL